MTLRTYQLPSNIHDDRNKSPLDRTLRLYRLPSTIHDEHVGPSQLDYKIETLQTILYSTRLQVKPSHWTMTRDSIDYPLLYTMTGKAENFGL